MTKLEQFTNDDKWKGYYPIPNEQNKERILDTFYLYKKHLDARHFHADMEDQLKEILKWLPESALHNVYFKPIIDNWVLIHSMPNINGAKIIFLKYTSTVLNLVRNSESTVWDAEKSSEYEEMCKVFLTYVTKDELRG